MKPSLPTSALVVAGFCAPWVIAYAPLLLYADLPGWDGPGNAYYVLALAGAGVVANLVGRTRSSAAVAGLLLGAGVLLVSRSAPLVVLLAYLIIVLTTALSGRGLAQVARKLALRARTA